MILDRNNTLNTNQVDSTDLLNPHQAINTMIELRIQLAELEQQILALQPAFFTACLALNTDKIAFERAIITRRLTPGQWTHAWTVDLLFRHSGTGSLVQTIKTAFSTVP